MGHRFSLPCGRAVREWRMLLLLLPSFQVRLVILLISVSLGQLRLLLVLRVEKISDRLVHFEESDARDGRLRLLTGLVPERPLASRVLDAAVFCLAM